MDVSCSTRMGRRTGTHGET